MKREYIRYLHAPTRPLTCDVTALTASTQLPEKQSILQIFNSLLQLYGENCETSIEQQYVFISADFVTSHRYLQGKLD